MGTWVRLTACCAVIWGVCLAVAVLSSAAEPVYISVNAGGPRLEIRPSQIHLVSNEKLEDIRWTDWGGATAHGVAIDRANAPTPGLSSRNPVEVEVLDRRTCGERQVYTTVQLHFTAGVPYRGQPTVTRYAYGCPHGASPDELLIRSTSRLGLMSFGGMRYGGDVSLGRAIQLWGEPDSRTPRFGHGEGCRVRWRQLGIDAAFLNLSLRPEGTTACDTEDTTNLDFLKISGRSGRAAWRTDRGVRVGSTVRYLVSRYPKARRRRAGGVRWLVTGRQEFGQGCPCTVARLYAVISRKTSKISSLNLLISGAGD